MDAAVPAVPVADDGDALGVGRPHGEGATAHAVHLPEVGAEFFVELAVVALGEEVQVELAQHRAEAVGVRGGELLALVGLDAQSVVGTLVRSLQHQLEKSARVDAGHGRRRGVGPAGVEQGDLLRVGLKDAHGPAAVADLVRAEEAERIAVDGGEQGVEFVGVKREVEQLHGKRRGRRAKTAAAMRIARQGGRCRMPPASEKALSFALTRGKASF